MNNDNAATEAFPAVRSSVSGLTLKSMAMEASLKMLSTSALGSGKVRDARGKKNFRNVLDQTLPRELQYFDLCSSQGLDFRGCCTQKKATIYLGNTAVSRKYSIPGNPNAGKNRDQNNVFSQSILTIPWKFPGLEHPQKDENLQGEGNRHAKIVSALISKAVEKFFPPDRMLNFLDIFKPNRTIVDAVDMLGSFRSAYGCHLTETGVAWSDGTFDTFNLTVSQCNRLYQLISWSGALTNKSLRSIILSTEPDAFSGSNLPHILSRSSSLTEVTLLNGATDHILRILGKNCPALKILNVSHSTGVSDAGLAGLILAGRRHTFGRRGRMTVAEARAVPPEEKNPCAVSLCKIVLMGTIVSLNAVNLSCAILQDSYYVAFIPDVMIVRAYGACRHDVQGTHVSTRVENEASLHPLFGREEPTLRQVGRILGQFVTRRAGTEGTLQVLEHHELPRGNGDRSAYNFVRGVDSYLAEGMFVTRSMNTDETILITQLILFWDSFEWPIAGLPDLDELGVCLPNLVVLKARLRGKWDRAEPLFPNLRETYIWTVSDTTMLSFLRSSPKIEILNFSCLDLLGTHEEQLTDATLAQALSANPTLLTTLVEVCISPGRDLHPCSARFLLQRAPKLKRLGDIESWRVTLAEMKQLGEEMDKANSKCILTVLSFPPKEKHQYLF
ncbi:hypothetical protein Fcan01_18394 [Folsomia candida]|uniref:Uncharacterized protein n=1 Tax=Folsomia candida TaxID=158441 RepID=A0A226DQJ8_FOLCA|nr:hypothetical protein Fcan01_18394 [Folsomia candida]